MSGRPKDVSRRNFLSAGAGVAALTASSLASAQEDVASGSTGLRFGVSILVDALNAVGSDGRLQTMSGDIGPLTHVAGVVMGPAVTTKWQPGLGRMNGDDVRENMFVPLDEAEPGSIWVVAGNSDRPLSLFGGVIAAACKRNGLAAAVTDNGCRDVDTFDEIGFPVFAQRAVPYGPGAFTKPVAANVPVDCGGVEVHPGDTVAADRDGIVVVPADVHDEVIAAAQEIIARERATMSRIDDGESLVDAYRI